MSRVHGLHCRLFLFVFVLLIPLLLPIAPAQAQTGDPFTDLYGHWAERYIRTLYYAGVIDAPEDGRFRPDDPATRIDFAVWVANALELSPAAAPAEPPFADWDEIDPQAQGHVLAAVEEGLIRGYDDGTFKPQGVLTRAEMAVIFGRALEKLGVKAEERFRHAFADGDEIPDWALPALAARRAGVIIGVPRNQQMYFLPYDVTTRAEAAAMLLRFVEKRFELLDLEMPEPVRDIVTEGIIFGPYYMVDAFDRLDAHGSLLDWLVYASYNMVDADGTLFGYDPPSTLAWAGRTRTPVIAMIASHQQSVNDAFFDDPAAQDNFLNEIRALIEKGYSGIHLDFEYVPARHRQAYTEFVRKVASYLRAQHLHISIAVPAKTQENNASNWVGAFDYAALGDLVDYVMIMTYDHHWRGGPPGPIGGLPWVRAVLNYAVQEIPRDKILMGVPAYAYDWPLDGGTGRALTSRRAAELQAERGRDVRFDPATGELSFRYADDDGSERIVYYTPPEGLALKLALAKEFRLAGVAMWRMGQEMDAYWPVIADWKR